MEVRALQLPVNPTLLKEIKNSELTLDQLISRAVTINGTSAGEHITPRSALKSPTVYAIVNRLSSMFAQLPFSIVKDESRGDGLNVTTVRSHPVTRLINRRPNQWQTSYQFKANMMTNLLLHGAYAGFVGRAGQEARFVTPIDLSKASVEITRRNRLLVTWTTEAGMQSRAFQDQLLYITGPVSLDGIRPEPPIERCRESIALEIAAEKFGASTFGSSAVPTLILMRKGVFADDEVKSRFKTMWDATFGRNKRGTAILEGDEWEIQKVQMNNDEAQFLETRKLQRSILAGLFNVPPHMVGDLERATFSNISSQSLEVLMYTLAPWLECIERAIERAFLTEDEIENQFLAARFDTKRLMRGDLKSTAEFITKLRQVGVMSANEGRSMLDMNARDDEEGNSYMTPLNFQSNLDDDDKEPDDTGQPPPEGEVDDDED